MKETTCCVCYSKFPDPKERLIHYCENCRHLAEEGRLGVLEDNRKRYKKEKEDEDKKNSKAI